MAWVRILLMLLIGLDRLIWRRESLIPKDPQSGKNLNFKGSSIPGDPQS